MGEKAYKRKIRNYFIEPRFQRHFLLYLMGTNLLGVLFCAGVIFPVLSKHYQSYLEIFAWSPETAEILISQYNFLLTIMGSTMVIYFAYLFVLGVMYSHRVGGVIYAVKRTCRELSEGKDVRLHLRKSDEFQDLHDSFNTMVDTLKGQQAQAKKDTAA